VQVRSVDMEDSSKIVAKKEGDQEGLLDKEKSQGVTQKDPKDVLKEMIYISNLISDVR
jgi:hypothetical protein